jgi:hypothetical protein
LFLFLSPFYSICMWLYGPIGLDLCSLQPPVFEAFYRHLGMTVRNLFFRTISSFCDSGAMLVCLIPCRIGNLGSLLGVQCLCLSSPFPSSSCVSPACRATFI